MRLYNPSRFRCRLKSNQDAGAHLDTTTIADKGFPLPTTKEWGEGQPKELHSCGNEPLSPLVPHGERGEFFLGRVDPGWRSCLADPGLLSGHPYGISIWLEVHNSRLSNPPDSKSLIEDSEFVRVITAVVGFVNWEG